MRYELIDRYSLSFYSESRVLIIQSAVPGAFCSGADLKVKKEESVGIFKANYL
jgi:enoyl-CoA hydratase/carnithine racemase